MNDTLILLSQQLVSGGTFDKTAFRKINFSCKQLWKRVEASSLDCILSWIMMDWVRSFSALHPRFPNFQFLNWLWWANLGFSGWECSIQSIGSSIITSNRIASFFFSPYQVIWFWVIVTFKFLSSNLGIGVCQWLSLDLKLCISN